MLMFNNFEIQIELDKPVTIGGPIRTVCLPDDSPVGDLVGDEVVVAGWGKLTRLVKDCWGQFHQRSTSSFYAPRSQKRKKAA